nr:MAG TPA_asm: hypothetical protein [Caudoviricetes sp.]
MLILLTEVLTLLFILELLFSVVCLSLLKLLIAELMLAFKLSSLKSSPA